MLTSYSNYINFFYPFLPTYRILPITKKKFRIFLIFNFIPHREFRAIVYSNIFFYFLFFSLIIILYDFDSFPRENRENSTKAGVEIRKEGECSRDKMNISRAVMFAYDFHRVNHSMVSIVLMATLRWNLLICKLDAKWIIDRDSTSSKGDRSWCSCAIQNDTKHSYIRTTKVFSF